MAFRDQSKWIKASGIREINISISEWLAINSYKRTEKSRTRDTFACK